MGSSHAGIAEFACSSRFPVAAVRGFSMPAWAKLLDAHGELIGYGLVSDFALLWIGSTLGPDRDASLALKPKNGG